MKDKIYAKRKLRKQLRDGDVFIATAELSSIGDQAPYFSITGYLYDRNRNNGDSCVMNAAGRRRWLGSCGCLHDETAEYIPEFAPLIRWHLTSTDGPMHYMANAIYHAGFCLGMENSRNIEHLKSTIVYGAVETDAAVDLESLDAAGLQAFLVARFPALMAQFKADVNAFFGEEVVKDVATEAQPYEGQLSTDENRAKLRAKKRQQIIDQAAKKIREETIERDGMLWLFDHGISIENVIYYSHTNIFTFGWRELVSDEEAGKILDVISEFPFEYKIKSKSKLYSAREAA